MAIVGADDEMKFMARQCGNGCAARSNTKHFL